MYTPPMLSCVSEAKQSTYVHCTVCMHTDRSANNVYTQSQRFLAFLKKDPMPVLNISMPKYKNITFLVLEDFLRPRSTYTGTFKNI